MADSDKISADNKIIELKPGIRQPVIIPSKESIMKMLTEALQMASNNNILEAILIYWDDKDALRFSCSDISSRWKLIGGLESVKSRFY